MKYKHFYERQLTQVLRMSGLSRSRYFMLDQFSYKFVNFLVKSGNKRAAFRTFLSSLFLIKKLTLMSPIYFLRRALFNMKSIFTVTPVYKGKWVFYKTQFLNSSMQLKRSIRLLLQVTNKIASDNVDLNFSQALSIAILNCSFQHGHIFKDLRKNHLKIKSKRLKFTSKYSKNPLKVRFRRTRKTKGFYFMNRYGLYKRIQPLN